jgi:aryl-alcohol dehydrogenase-like predicted oxidoreductase
MLARNSCGNCADSSRPGGNGLLRSATSEKEFEVIDVVRAVADELQTSAAAVALAWVHHRPGVAGTLIGARRIDQLRDNLSALEIRLNDDQAARLDKVSTPKLHFPADFNGQLACNLAFAGATVDGQATEVFPLLATIDVRY